ncbi:MAG TPA: Dabb family protein [archaeon]|nr:Dabb family protein [archaeon]
MIIHVALFSWKPGTKEKEINRALNDVIADQLNIQVLHKLVTYSEPSYNIRILYLVNYKLLKKKVDGLIDIRCGENFSKWNEGFTHAVIVMAKTRTALDAYRFHPFHKKVADKIEKMEEKSVGVDFED